jgi:hypothetical protein
MRLISWSRPSPAMVVAVIALTGALAGTAIAGPDAITSAVTKSKVKKIAKQQANKQIKKKAGGLSVANAQNATNATTAANANAPSVYAQVTQDGNVEASRSRGVNSDNVTQIANTGVYCFTGLPAFKSVQATQFILAAPPADQVVVVTPILNDLSGICAGNGVPNSQLIVLTSRNDNGALDAEGFTLWFAN